MCKSTTVYLIPHKSNYCRLWKFLCTSRSELVPICLYLVRLTEDTARMDNFVYLTSTGLTWSANGTRRWDSNSNCDSLVKTGICNRMTVFFFLTSSNCVLSQILHLKESWHWLLPLPKDPNVVNIYYLKWKILAMLIPAESLNFTSFKCKHVLFNANFNNRLSI